MGIPTFEDIFGQIRFNLWLAGVPLSGSRLTFCFYVYLVALIMVISGEIGFFTTNMSANNFLVLVDLTTCISTGVNAVLKFVFIALKRQNVCQLTKALDKLYSEILKDKIKKGLVKKTNVILNNIVKYYFLLNAILIFVYSFSTLFAIAYHYAMTKEIVYLLPYPILVPFSTDTWLPWLIIYVLLIITGFVATLYFTTADALYCVLTSHVCSNFLILSDELTLLDKASSHQLTSIVKRHQFILRLAEDLEDVFSKPNFLNVLLGSLNICALGFSLIAGDVSRLPGFVLFLTSVLLQILMMSVFGDNLMKESVKVGRSAFLCDWREMDEKSKKIILIIMIRSNKPQRLTAYKFSTIGYESFTKIISTSWSYFTILKTVYKPTEQ